MNYIKALYEDGYVLIKKAIDPLMVSNLLEEIRDLYDSVPAPQGSVPYLNLGHKMIYNLQNKDLLFVTSVFRHPVVKEILTHFLNDEWYKQVSPNYILRSMIARSGGAEALPLHVDSFIPSSGRYAWSMQVAFILENQTEENGCTVVVPGSHVNDWYANQAVTKTPVPSEAGDILIFDSRLWHGTTGNQTDGTRWALITTFCRWWIKQNYDITGEFPFKDSLTKEELAIMGYCSIPPKDEYEYIDMKGGYERI